MADLDLGEDAGEGLDERGEGGGEDDPVPGPEDGAVDLHHAEGGAETPDVLFGVKKWV